MNLTYASLSTMEIQVKVIAVYVLRDKKWEALTAYFIIVVLEKDGTPKIIPP